jgi:sucrose-6-phosphate hydrolase SacC (GH32 family)
MMGWMNNWQYAAKVPTQPWRGQMTIPRRLQLTATPAGLRLVQSPAEALEQLRGSHIAWTGEQVADLNGVLKGRAARGSSFELRSSVVPGPSGKVGWKLLAGDGKYTTVGYDAERGELFVDRAQSGDVGFSRDFPGRTSAPLVIGSAPLELTILADRSTLEVFAQGGQVAITNLVYPPAGAHGIEFFVDGGKPGRIRVDLWELKSTWTPRE